MVPHASGAWTILRSAAHEDRIFDFRAGDGERVKMVPRVEPVDTYKNGAHLANNCDGRLLVNVLKRVQNLDPSGYRWYYDRNLGIEGRLQAAVDLRNGKKGRQSARTSSNTEGPSSLSIYVVEIDHPATAGRVFITWESEVTTCHS